MDENEKKVKQKRERIRLDQITTAMNQHKYTEMENSVKTDNMTKFILGAAAFVLILLLLYMLYFPTPIFEEAEEMVRNASSPAEIDYSLLHDPNAVSEDHNEIIQETMDMYSARRDEIVEYIKTGPINDKAIQVCRDMIAAGDYGPTAQFGSLSWDIPESAEQLNLTLSAEEADKVLYLYSCLYDLDYLNGDDTSFEDWFYGVEGTYADYPVEAFGNTYYMPGRGGHYLDPALLNEARIAADKAGNDAMSAARASRTQNVFSVPLLSAIVKEAEAADIDAYRSAYRETMQSYYDTYGQAAADLIIYTGISDQIHGEITFSLSTTPLEIWEGTTSTLKDRWYGTIERYDRDDAAKAIVAEYNAMPFMGRPIVEIDDVVEYLPTDEDYYTDYESKWDDYLWRYVDSPISVLGSRTTHTKHTTYVTIQIYQCLEFVDFIAKANITGSGIGDAISKLVSIAEAQIGIVGDTKFNGGRGRAWCADFVSWCADQVDLVDDGTLLDAAGCAYYYGVLTSPTDTVVSDGVTYGKGYSSYANSSIAQFNNGEGYAAVPGDIIFWRNQAGEWSHIGIVTEVSDSSITVTQGNYANDVRRIEYASVSDGIGLERGAIVHPIYPQGEDYEKYFGTGA